jgi:hypothetical protein
VPGQEKVRLKAEQQTETLPENKKNVFVSRTKRTVTNSADDSKQEH